MMLSVVASQAAAAAAAFNLVCSGTITEEFAEQDPVRPYRYEYRVDLDARKWCEGECKVIRDVYDVQPLTLRLEAPRDIDTVTQREYFNSWINRETGKHRTLSISGRDASTLMLEWNGQCTRAPFSGFPKMETKI